MTQQLAIACIQVEPQGNNQQLNLEHAEGYIRQAAREGADIALTPEMLNIGYTGFEGTDPETIAEWQGQAVATSGAWVQHFARLARELEIAIAVGYLQQWPGAPRNAVTLFDRHGLEQFTYAKVHTCDFSSFEASTTPGEDWYVAPLDTKQGEVMTGAMICYDREFPESARVNMLKGAELVLTPNACVLPPDRIQQFSVRGMENSMIMAMANYAGPDYQGRSMTVDAMGAVQAMADDTEQILWGRFDIEALRQIRKSTIWGAAFRRPGRYKALVEPDYPEVFTRNTGLGQPFDPNR